MDIKNLYKKITPVLAAGVLYAVCSGLAGEAYAADKGNAPKPIQPILQPAKPKPVQPTQPVTVKPVVQTNAGSTLEQKVTGQKKDYSNDPVIKQYQDAIKNQENYLIVKDTDELKYKINAKKVDTAVQILGDGIEGIIDTNDADEQNAKRAISENNRLIREINSYSNTIKSDTDETITGRNSDLRNVGKELNAIGNNIQKYTNGYDAKKKAEEDAKHPKTAVEASSKPISLEGLGAFFELSYLTNDKKDMPSGGLTYKNFRVGGGGISNEDTVVETYPTTNFTGKGTTDTKTSKNIVYAEFGPTLFDFIIPYGKIGCQLEDKTRTITEEILNKAGISLGSKSYSTDEKSSSLLGGAGLIFKLGNNVAINCGVSKIGKQTSYDAGVNVKL